jgi:hypothetical protein
MTAVDRHSTAAVFATGRGSGLLNLSPAIACGERLSWSRSSPVTRGPSRRKGNEITMESSRMIPMLVVAGLAVLDGVAGWRLWRIKSPPTLTEICETELRERLRVPATYVRIAAAEYADPVSVEDYFDARTAELRSLYGDAPSLIDMLLERDREEATAPEHRVVFLTYDAANVCGASIRAVGKCEYLAANSRVPAKAGNVTLEGKTHHDWVLWSIDEARRAKMGSASGCSQDEHALCDAQGAAARKWSISACTSRR